MHELQPRASVLLAKDDLDPDSAGARRSDTPSPHATSAVDRDRSPGSVRGVACLGCRGPSGVLGARARAWACPVRRSWRTPAAALLRCGSMQSPDVRRYEPSTARLSRCSFDVDVSENAHPGTPPAAAQTPQGRGVSAEPDSRNAFSGSYADPAQPFEAAPALTACMPRSSNQNTGHPCGCLHEPAESQQPGNRGGGLSSQPDPAAPRDPAFDLRRASTPVPVRPSFARKARAELGSMSSSGRCPLPTRFGDPG
jgi:hypothetical protein